jgi:uncharacterized RDD family membrane protein YckC
MASSPSVLDGTHRVVTPEYVEFDFVLAGIQSRFLALLIDQVIVVTGTIAVLTVLSTGMSAFPGFASALAYVVLFLMDWGYYIGLETIWSGQTIGKRILGLRVIQENGVRIGFFHAAVRNLLRLLDRLPILYLVGGVFVLFSETHQRLGDMLAGTIVIRERRLKIPASVARPEGETRLLEDPQFQERAAKLTAEEQDVLFSAAIRREELGMEARLKLFAELSTRLQEENGFTKPEHLSDEKMVLLVAAALARQSREKRTLAPVGKSAA